LFLEQLLLLSANLALKFGWFGSVAHVDTRVPVNPEGPNYSRYWNVPSTMTLGLDDGGDVDGDADEEYGDVINVGVLVGINVGVSDGVIVGDSVCVTAGYSVHMIEGDVIGETEGNSV
jgi:hypothetical protein